MSHTSPLWLEDSGAARFLSGGLTEALSLFGAPLPLLPPPETDEGQIVWYARFDPLARTQLVRFLQSLLQQIGADLPGASHRTEAGSREQAEFGEVLEGMIRAARIADRRLGLLNLLWLSLSREVAEALAEIESRAPTVRRLKHSLHPLLQTFFRRADQEARRAVERLAPGLGPFQAGSQDNPALIDAILDDGFAFTEPSVAGLDFNQFLAANKRYRLGPDLFFEFHQALYRETERRLKEGDRGLLLRVAKHLPGLSREQAQAPAGLVRVMLNLHVFTYLLADAWSTGSRLTTSPKLRAEVERGRRPADLVDAFLDLVSGLKRFELLARARDRIRWLKGFGHDAELEESRSRGLRVYDFGQGAQVWNDSVNATVLFLDLRGFTKTSEGLISEQGLTRQLYEVFDAFVPHVLRFGGTVDKFLGDGIMVHYGTTHEDPLDPLHAVRTAILCQERLARLREEGRTAFQMGVAIHFGRVHVARFIADDSNVQVTVIGRNVNLAGRLSSGAKKAPDEDAGDDPHPTGHAVTVEDGVLMNEGIVISRDTLVRLDTYLCLVQNEEAGVLEYFDEEIGRRITFRYAGDARFKGVRSSCPVYEVDFDY